MKLQLGIVLLTFILSSCGEEMVVNQENEKLEGYWLLTEITGGFAGNGYKANFDHLQINKGQQYSLMVQDAVIQEGNYQLKEEEDQLFIQFIPNASDTIPFDNEEKRIILNDEGNILTLMEPCCDLYNYSFLKED